MAEEESAAGTGKVPREQADREQFRLPIRLYLMVSSVFLVVLAMVGYHYAVRGMVRLPVEERFVVPAADPERGPELLRVYGCVGCHTIPGVPGADGHVGPRLDRVREPAYIAGVLPNSPQNLVIWIQKPKDVDPKTAMPNLGVTETDARDIAAYLYSIR